MTRTLFFFSGCRSQAKFYMKEYMQKVGGKWTRMRATDTFAQSIGQELVIIRPLFDEYDLKGQRNFVIIRCGQWYKRPRPLIEQVEFFERTESVRQKLDSR